MLLLNSVCPTRNLILLVCRLKTQRGGRPAWTPCPSISLSSWQSSGPLWRWVVTWWLWIIKRQNQVILISSANTFFSNKPYLLAQLRSHVIRDFQIFLFGRSQKQGSCEASQRTNICKTNIWLKLLERHQWDIASLCDITEWWVEQAKM